MPAVASVWPFVRRQRDPRRLRCHGTQHFPSCPSAVLWRRCLLAGHRDPRRVGRCDVVRRCPPDWGGGSTPIENSAFLVEGDTFTWVGRQGEAEPPEGAARVDLSGQTVIPALIGRSPAHWASEYQSRDEPHRELHPREPRGASRANCVPRRGRHNEPRPRVRRATSRSSCGMR